MVLKGKIRGNGGQLAGYLLRKGDNDNVQVFDIRGTTQPDDLRKSLLQMSLTSELTKSDKGLFHAQINPRPGEDKKMKRKDWLRAAEILEQELGLTSQKRIMVMHEKKKRKHMHVAWERYDHDKRKMRSDKFSRLAQDRARQKMEIEFEQQRTPKRNKHRPVMKEEITTIWFETDTARDFMQAVEAKGYAIAAGTKRPYQIVDHTGTTFNLVKQIMGVKTADVRKRLKGIRLIDEKAAIEQVRDRQRAEKTKQVQQESQAKSPANENVKAPYSMSMSFTMTPLPEQPKQVSQTEKERFVKKATLFRENETSLLQEQNSTIKKRHYMDWEEIVERQGKEYKEYLKGYKESQEQLATDKKALLKLVDGKEEMLPDNLKDKIIRDKAAWQQEWGMYGSRFKNMRVAHQKEVDKYFRAQDLQNEMEEAQKKKQNDRGR